ncbi:MAG: hypothetical protein PWP31_531 [Clostridia bacterium]|nr:hypothetical protein [Clostridia bacterium]
MVKKMNDIYNFLGLAYRAKNLVWGYQTVNQNLKKGNIYLVILATDTSPKFKSKFITLCHKYNSQELIFGKKNDIGAALGKPPCAVVGITDENMAKTIWQKVLEVGV